MTFRRHFRNYGKHQYAKYKRRALGYGRKYVRTQVKGAKSSFHKMLPALLAAAMA